MIRDADDRGPSRAGSRSSVEDTGGCHGGPDTGFDGVRESGDREIESRRVGELVMEALRGLDQVAYVRFASVYRSFEDVKAFLEEIERLENDLPPGVREQQLALIPAERPDKTPDRS